jgi:hypothetical protein
MKGTASGIGAACDNGRARAGLPVVGEHVSPGQYGIH